jgi:predicted DNA-binding transcriptional regulator AlpA
MKKDNKEDINLNNELGYINGKEILNFFGVSSETIKTWMDNKGFPDPISITPKTRLWKCSEIKEWIDEKR